MTLSMNDLIEKKANAREGAFGPGNEVPEPVAKVAKAPVAGNGNGNAKAEGHDNGKANGSGKANGKANGNGKANLNGVEGDDAEVSDDVEKKAKDKEDKAIMRASKIKETIEISREDLDLSEDLSAMFEGSDLSEETQEKITVIFETAVVTKINEKLAELSAQLAEETTSAQDQVCEELTDKMDQYLDHVVEHWLEDNKLAVETGIKTQLTEEFLAGLKNLFTEHYINIPEEQVNVVEELAARVSELEEKLNSQIDENVGLRQEIEGFEHDVAFVEVAEGLTETQIAKLESLSESINAESPVSYKTKLQTLRENYFPADTTRSNDKTLDDEPVDADGEEGTQRVTPEMSSYMSAISRAVKK